MKKYILAASLAGILAAPAMAQPVGAAPFTGPRIEGVIGYDGSDPLGPREGGALYGVGIGYDFQAGGGAVIGLGTELTGTTTESCVVTGPGAQGLCSNIGRDIAVTGRVGGLINPNTLVYGLAGYTNVSVSTEETGPNRLPGTVRENLDGFRVGGGLEYAIGPNSFVKGEYRYSNYSGGLDRHQGLVGFGFRF